MGKTKKKAPKKTARRREPEPTLGHLDANQRPQLAEGAPVFVRWDVGRFKLGILTGYTKDGKPQVRVGHVDPKGRYTGDFGKPPRTFNASEVSRVYMERDWLSFDILKSTGVTNENETAKGFDERIARGPAHDEVQRPRGTVKDLLVAQDVERDVGLEVDDEIKVLVGRKWESVVVTRFDRAQVHFVAEDGTTGVREWSHEGKDWIRLDPRCLQPNPTKSQSHCKYPRGHEGDIHGDGSGLTWECVRTTEDIGRVPKKFLDEKGIEESPIEVAPLPNPLPVSVETTEHEDPINPASRRARAVDPDKAAKAVERERKGVARQSKKALATATGNDPNPSPVDRAVATSAFDATAAAIDARTPTREMSVHQRNVAEAKRLGIPLHRYMEQKAAEEAAKPTDVQLADAREHNRKILEAMGGSTSKENVDGMFYDPPVDSEELAVASKHDLRATVALDAPFEITVDEGMPPANVTVEVVGFDPGDSMPWE